MEICPICSKPERGWHCLNTHIYGELLKNGPYYKRLQEQYPTADGIEYQGPTYKGTAVYQPFHGTHPLQGQFLV
jgi:hypothetical protein